MIYKVSTWIVVSSFGARANKAMLTLAVLLIHKQGKSETVLLALTQMDSVLARFLKYITDGKIKFFLYFLK